MCSLAVVPRLADSNDALLDDATPLAQYLQARGGAGDELNGLVVTSDNGDAVIPNCFLAGPCNPYRLVRNINSLYLRNCTSVQRYLWWTTPTTHLGGKPPAALLDLSPGIDRILMGMARNYDPANV